MTGSPFVMSEIGAEMKTVEIGDRLDPYAVPESRPSIGDRLLLYEVHAVVDLTDDVIPIVWIEEMEAAG